MPTLFILFGLRFYFYSEEHNPIHVHIENSDGRAKIQLEPEVILVKNEGIKPKDIKKAVRFAKLYREEIIKEWKVFHEG